MKPLVIVAATAGILIAGCGSSSSPEDQVRSTEVKMIEAITSAHPERACQYERDHDLCVSGVMALHGLKMDPSAVIGIPDDWRARVKAAKVTVTGDSATISPITGGKGKPTRLTRLDGRWVIEN